MGHERFDLLLRLSRAQNEQQLAPIWSRLANTKKSSWASTVQAAYDSVKENLNEPHLTMVANTAMVNTTVSLSWYLTTKDAIDTGINPFRFGETDLEAAQQLQATIELMLSGQANPTLADAQHVLDTKVVLPSPDNSNRNVRRMQIWALTWLPNPHPLQQYLHQHYSDMESFRSEWSIWSPMKIELTPAKGILHLKYLATEISEYWKEQGHSPRAIALPDPKHITNHINREQMWEPVLTPSFITRYNIIDFCRVYNPSPAVAPYAL